MKKATRFNNAEAAFLARAAQVRETVTYGEFAERFGGIAQGQGGKLTEMGLRLKDVLLPLLPVLVVNKVTKLPSGDAKFYATLGMNEEDVKMEQERCFAHDWTRESFWEAES